MLSFHNQVQLIGRAGHDVELLSATDKTPRATLRLYQNNPSPSGTVEAQVHRLVGWGSVAVQLERNVRRGDRLMIQGRLVNRKFEFEGRTQVRTEIHLSQFTVLGSRSVTRSAGIRSLRVAESVSA